MLAKIVLVLQSTLLGFFAGAFYKALTMPEGSGLAGGAIVLFSGIIGAALTLVLALFLVQRFTLAVLKRINLALFLLLLIPIGWVIYRIQSKPPNEGLKPRREITEPVKVPLRFQV
tara:strand:+ start:504 stop:851 length:348 start_codon:yes stop_codon:yes gene_type:complete